MRKKHKKVVQLIFVGLMVLGMLFFTILPLLSGQNIGY